MLRLILFLCLFLPQLANGQTGNLSATTSLPEGRVRQFIDKLERPVILDFFSSTCAVCFKMLPKLKEFQELYRDRLQFVLVGLEDEQIRSVYQQFEKKLNLAFPVLYDSILPRQLGITEYPTYVWINPDKTIRVISGIDDLTADNLEGFIADVSDALPQRPKTSYTFEPAKPLLVNNNGGSDESVIYRFTLGRWQPGQPVYLPPALSASKHLSRFQVLGASLHTLYNYLIHGVRSWDTRSVLYGQAYPGVLFQPDGPADQYFGKDKNYVMSIELSANDADTSRLRRVLANELRNYTGYEAKLECRLMPCWFLRATPGSKRRLRSAGGERSLSITHAGLQFKNVPVSELITTLFSHNQLEHPFIDQTGISANIDITFNAILFDLEDVRKALLAEGLELVKGEKEMKVIVLNEAKNVATE